MNVKLLFFPLSITIAIAVFVFYVKPEVDVVMTNRSTLVEKGDFSTSIKQKIQNIGSLESDLNANKENESLVMRYLPSMRDDDRVVDGINFLASQSGLLLTSVKIEKVATETQAAASAGPEVGLASGSGIVPLVGGGVDIAAVKSEAIVPSVPKLMKVSVTMVGTYESIRDVATKISHTDHFQNFSMLSIERSSSTADASSDQPSNPNILNASMSVNYAYLPQTKAKGNYNRPILDQTAFDYGSVQRLKQYMSAPVPNMEIGASGTSNPFLR